MYVGQIITMPFEMNDPDLRLCDGSELSQVDFPLLYSRIGDLYGQPSSADNFRLPDYRGCVLMGERTGLIDLGDRTGEVEVTLSVSNLPPHNHTLTDSGVDADVYVTSSADYTNETDGGNNTLNDGGSTPGIYAESGQPTSKLGGVVVSGNTELTGSGAPVSVIQPSVGVNHYIKVQ